MQSTENSKAKGLSLSFLRNVGWNLFGQIAPLVAALISIPILVKHLGVDRFGLLTIAWMLIGYFSLFDLGIGRALTQLLAQRIAQGRHRSVGPLLWTGTAAMAILGLVAMMVLGISAHWIAYSALKIPSELRTETYWALLSLTPALPAVMLAAAFRGALEAKHAFKLVNLVRIPLGVLMFVAPLCLLPFSNSLVGVFASLLAVRLLTCVAFWLCLRGEMPDALSYRFDRRLLPQLFRFGGWMTVTNIVSPLMVQMDRFVIGAMLSTAAVAYYSTPFEMVSKVLIIPGAIAGVCFPAFAKYFGERNFIAAGNLLKQSIVITAVVLGLVTVIALALAKIVLNIWVGEAFALHSTSVMKMLIVGMLINGVGHIPFSFIQGIGKPKITAQFHLMELVIYAPLVIFLIEVHGIIGAAVAWTLRAAIDTTLLTGYSFFALRRARDGNSLQYSQKG